jgi:hypothetical protein
MSVMNSQMLMKDSVIVCWLVRTLGSEYGSDGLGEVHRCLVEAPVHFVAGSMTEVRTH